MRTFTDWQTHIFFACAMCLAAPTSEAAFIDRGSYTTVTGVGIDVYDPYAFAGMTHQEVLDSVSALGQGWRLAWASEMYPVFLALDEATYLDHVRHLFGFYTIRPEGIDLYITAGRVADFYADYPTFNYLWGLGNGIQVYRHDLQQVTYIWSYFGIGWELGNMRVDDWGAWVIRPAMTVPEPMGIVMFALALVSIAAARRRRQ